ncbi:MAG: tetratricopeptide repeat protein, partial [Bacteroidota bacterium]
PLADEFNNVYEGSRARGNMAILYAMQEKYELAEEWFIRDIQFDEKNGDLYAVNKSYNNLGVLYERTGQLEKALSNYQTALDIALQIDDRSSVAIGYQNLGQIYSQLKQYSSAIRYFQRGIQLNRQMGNRAIIRDAYLNLSQLYESMQQPGPALDYHKKYHLLNDSLIGDTHKAAVSELEIKYETSQREKEMLSLSEAKLKTDAALTQQSAYVRWLSVGLLVAVLFFAGAFTIFRQRTRLRAQREVAASIVATEVNERQRIAQDLHDSVGGMLALSTTQLKSIQHSDTTAKLHPVIETLGKMSQQIRQIAHNLMPGELSKFGLEPAIQNLIDQIDHPQLSAQLHSNQSAGRLSANTSVQLYRIVQELIQNTLKHAGASELNVYLYQYDKHLTLMVEDNGKGMKQKAE